jgi:hypothetical protein
MKKSLLTFIAILGCSLFVSAQETIKDDPNEEAQDKMQQEPPRENQARIENAAQRSADRDKQTKKQNVANEQSAKQNTETGKVKKAKKAQPKNGKLNPAQ